MRTIIDFKCAFFVAIIEIWLSDTWHAFMHSERVIWSVNSNVKKKQSKAKRVTMLNLQKWTDLIKSNTIVFVSSTKLLRPSCLLAIWWIVFTQTSNVQTIFRESAAPSWFVIFLHLHRRLVWHKARMAGLRGFAAVIWSSPLRTVWRRIKRHEGAKQENTGRPGEFKNASQM